MTRRAFDFADPAVNGYGLLTALVVPRPIAWVSTVSADGVGNLAPHSFFTVASARPGVVQFTSVGVKDTLRNVRETGEFVVNVVPRWMLWEANASSAGFEAGDDEAGELDIAMEPSERVRPERVVGSPASLECRLHSEVEIGDSVVVFGTVLLASVDERALEGDHPTIAGLQPLSRLGRSEWGLPPETFEASRPRAPQDIAPRE